jgi:hypothetical protein
MGKDMLIQKWYSPVYSVPGLSDVTISHAITPAPGDTPSWETTNIEILATEDVDLSLARITVNP